MNSVTMMGTGSLLVALVGCAGFPAPTDKYTSAVANIRAAQEDGAATVPQAALHLRLAQEELTRAKALMGDGKNEEASFETLRATGDAELAVALARQATAEARAAEITTKASDTERDGATVKPDPKTFSATTTTTSTTVPATK